MIKKGKKYHVAHDYSLSETSYSYGYNLRLKYSSFMHDTLSWIWNNYAELLTEENPKILSLGCGNGLFDTELIKIIQQQKKNWSFTGVDFNVTDLDHFRKNLSSLNRETQSRISLEYNKFSPSTNMGEHYDLITMIHFLHSFDDIIPIIKNALRHLTPNGKLLIVQQRKQGIAELKASFLDLLPNQKFQSSDQIRGLLQSEKIAFTSQAIDTYFDISIMKKMSLDALILMSFCLCNDLSVLNTQQQENIRKAFLFLAREEISGNQFIDEKMEVIVCQA